MLPVGRRSTSSTRGFRRLQASTETDAPQAVVRAVAEHQSPAVTNLGHSSLPPSNERPVRPFGSWSARGDGRPGDVEPFLEERERQDHLPAVGSPAHRVVRAGMVELRPVERVASDLGNDVSERR
jgi:hypothetical protein